ncbi:MAG: hypothetical protein HY294_11340 [Candidatus Rokubacteria bacterium]|nr:hypothetical protein [Candidatus Rokubacteria bacterium]MBI3826581.1 hypothetical protein [Candidatus Rokubacteria bacterium]
MTQATEADEILAKALLADAAAHEAGRYASIADRYDDVYRELLPIQDLAERRLVIALHFWGGWCDASNHDWQYYRGIGKADWPRLARDIASDLRQGRDSTDGLVVAHFAPENMRPMRSRIWAGLRRMWKRST